MREERKAKDQCARGGDAFDFSTSELSLDNSSEVKTALESGNLARLNAIRRKQKQPALSAQEMFAMLGEENPWRPRNEKDSNLAPLELETFWHYYDYGVKSTTEVDSLHYPEFGVRLANLTAAPNMKCPYRLDDFERYNKSGYGEHLMYQVLSQDLPYALQGIQEEVSREAKLTMLTCGSEFAVFQLNDDGLMIIVSRHHRLNELLRRDCEGRLSQVSLDWADLMYDLEEDRIYLTRYRSSEFMASELEVADYDRRFNYGDLQDVYYERSHAVAMQAQNLLYQLGTAEAFEEDLPYTFVYGARNVARALVRLFETDALQEEEKKTVMSIMEEEDFKLPRVIVDSMSDKEAEEIIAGRKKAFFEYIKNTIGNKVFCAEISCRELYVL